MENKNQQFCFFDGKMSEKRSPISTVISEEWRMDGNARLQPASADWTDAVVKVNGAKAGYHTHFHIFTAYIYKQKQWKCEVVRGGRFQIILLTTSAVWEQSNLEAMLIEEKFSCHPEALSWFLEKHSSLFLELFWIFTHISSFVTRLYQTLKKSQTNLPKKFNLFICYTWSRIYWT